MSKFIRAVGVRIELDKTPNDEGFFLWNANGWHDIDDIEILIEKLKEAQLELATTDIKDVSPKLKKMLDEATEARGKQE